MQDVTITAPDGRRLTIGTHQPLAFILGPCVIESRDHALMTATRIAEIGARHGIPVIYKSSFDKANRTSGKSFRGTTLDEALRIFEAVKAATGLPVLTDVHEKEQCAIAAEVVDVLQIPAFLCRQTDLLEAAGATGTAVNVKKGQWMHPEGMAGAVKKVRSAYPASILATDGRCEVAVTERGTFLGYGDLVVDMRSFSRMRTACDAPVIFDATHSVQQPGGQGTSSGGQREFIPTLSRAAVAVGIDALFLETHPDPANALSDAATMLALVDLPALLQTLKAIEAAVR